MRSKKEEKQVGRSKTVFKVEREHIEDSFWQNDGSLEEVPQLKEFPERVQTLLEDNSIQKDG